MICLSRTIRPLAGACVLVALAAGCGDDEPETGPDGERLGGVVSFAWSVADTVRIVVDGPAVARWCPTGSWLELSAVSGDTGIMLAVYPADTLARGSYTIARVTGDSAPARPGATLGLRWFTPGLVVGYRGWTGSAELDRTGDRVSGRLQADAVAVAGEGSAKVEGTFTDVPVSVADSACAYAG